MDMEEGGCQDITDMGETLLEIARQANTGVMTEIVSKTPLGIEWNSPLKGQWFMFLSGMRRLVKGWNGYGAVNWSWNGEFADGTKERTRVTVPPEMMREIQDYLAELDAKEDY